METTMVELKETFRESFCTFADEVTVQRCLRLLQDYKITKEELCESFVLFSLEKKIEPREMTQGMLPKFESYLKKTYRQRTTECDAFSISSFPCGSPSRRGTTTEVTSRRDTTTAARETPMTTPRPVPLPGNDGLTDAPYLTSGKSFSERKKRGLNIRVLNAHLPQNHLSKRKTDENGVRLEMIGEPFSRFAKFMGNTLKKQVGYIENRIVDYTHAIKECYEIDATNPIDPPTLEAVWMCGMVCCDCDGRLNQASIKLLGSRLYSSASSVRMDVSQIHSFSLFPGQIVAVKASNPRGDCLRVAEIIAHIPTVSRSLQYSDCDRTHENVLHGGSFSVFVACGPFCSSEDLSYEALKEIASLVESQAFDLAIIIGPFLDDQHPIIQSGEAMDKFSRIVRCRVDPLLFKIGEACSSVAVIPSVNDVHHMPAFPQPPFDKKCHPHITMLPNPTAFIYSCASSFPNPSHLFFADGVTFGVCSQDVIKGLSTSTCEKEQSDRMDGLFKHLIGQRSFYPLFPPRMGACMDASHASRLEIPSKLDVLIAPSDLISYAKFLRVEERRGVHLSDNALPSENPGAAYGTTLCLNPGRVVKGSNGGTYAILNVSPGHDNPLMDLENECRVDIVGI